jgi:hypothetical protein
MSGGEIAASTYYSDHNLREMFTRENTERRRQGGATLRKHLTEKQDRQCLAKFVPIRRDYEVSNNNDAVIVWVQMQIELGKAAEISAELIEVAGKVIVPKRAVPFE